MVAFDCSPLSVTIQHTPLGPVNEDVIYIQCCCRGFQYTKNISLHGIPWYFWIINSKNLIYVFTFKFGDTHTHNHVR